MKSDRDLNSMPNVIQAKLRKEIREKLISKEVTEKSVDTNKSNSFLKRLSASDRVYSSFASAMTKSKSSIKFAEEIQKTSSDADDIEAATKHAVVANDDSESSSAPIERRRSPALARSLSKKFQGSGGTGKCFLCLTEYQVGDSVSSSPNPKCKDMFHTDCT